jgi:hypothetical protein
MSERQGIEPHDIIQGALSILVSDALNGIAPTDRYHYDRMAAVGLPAHQAAAEVQAFVAQFKRRARELAKGEPTP